MAVDEDVFKLGMRHYPAGVNVITTKLPDGRRTGLTATAVCSLSVDPPSLIACINKLSGSLAPIKEAGCFAVNMLSVHQADISQRFAALLEGDEKFSGSEWGELETGAPILEGATVAFDCMLDQLVDVHTHTVLVGRVLAVNGQMEAAEPLLYMNGQYGSFKPNA